MRSLLFAALWLIGCAANAGTIQLACTPPIKNTDGSSITGTISYTFHWGTSATALTNTVSSSTCAATITVPDPAPGASITYHAGAKAVVNGVASSLSNIVAKTFTTPFPTPEPPTGLRVVDPIAYRLDAGSHNKVMWARIGSVELETPCQSRFSVTIDGQTLHMIERRTQATPTGSLPYQVWAKCG